MGFWVALVPQDLPPTEDCCDIQQLLDTYGLEYTPDGQCIRWSVSNRKHPRNWPAARKIFDTSLIIFLDLSVNSANEKATYRTCVSTAGSTAADHARDEFGLNKTSAVFVFVSLSLFGQMIGGMIFPAWSEAFGRKKLYIGSTGLYSIFCLISATSPSLAGVAIGRFFAGFLSAMPAVVVASSIEDMYNTKDRIWLIFMWAVVANMGLAFGPIMSIYIIASLTWRWVFRISAVVTAIITLLLFGIRESRPSLVLEQEVIKLRRESGIANLKALSPDHIPDLETFVRVGLFLTFALIYLFTEALPPIYMSMGFSKTSSYLPFFAICIGFLFGIFTRIQDHRIIVRYQEQGIPLEPEHKLLGFSIGAPTLAVGLWWFSWTIPPAVHVHWLISTASLMLIGYGVNEFDSVLTGYLADSYLGYAASGFAAVQLLRSSMSAAFPLFATDMYDALGANVASSILAALATVFCIFPFLFRKYGRRIRELSKFANHSLQVYQENGVDKHGY
ncbi:hypothetical protein F1880_004284 [Penicillium rolfsii]|nr:hypothetical protein F1880_004284 [Penicillium rolfsii]